MSNNKWGGLIKQQGFAIILVDGQNMLVDAGKNDSVDTIINYLKTNGVLKLDYLVGTHLHEDHIGSLDAVIKNFQIGKFLMPKVATNTQTFRDVLTAVKNKGLQINTAKAGVDIVDIDKLSVKILAPCNTAYEDLNNYSAVIKVKYGDVAFILTGDAEGLSESEILESKADIMAQVLKAGHHGSNSSTSLPFLNAVSPQYAVISVGAGNDYHHPHQITLEKLKKAGVNVLRTDEKGTIIFATDGKEIAVATEK
ncbi:MAG: ComEC family competence protein [Pelotomaculum sp. PtaU1.Bin035]|nr:MAG: ComEC family competence protein [Pelotomaculum sp. PtaU1.Bin035]